MDITGNKIIDADIEEITSEALDWSYFAGKHILITGANGMLPAYIVYTLLGLNETVLNGRPCKVTANVRNYEKAKSKFERFLNRDDFQLLLKDVTELTEFCGNVDIVIHAASQAQPKILWNRSCGNAEGKHSRHDEHAGTCQKKRLQEIPVL